MNLRSLRRFAEGNAARERCELCGAALPAAHAHLVEPAARRIVCACDACGLLFDRPAAKFRRVPRDAWRLPAFSFSDEQWNRFNLPIGVAFLFVNSITHRVVAFYPSPAGAVESLLSLDAWSELSAENPILNDFAPDIEALLINRVRGPGEYFRTPIDACYRLAGLIRMHWRGFSGGDAAQRAIDTFFDEMRERARVLHA